MIICRSCAIRQTFSFTAGRGETTVNTSHGSVEYGGTAAWIKNIRNPQVYLYGGGTLRFSGRVWESDHETLQGKIEDFDGNGFYVSLPIETAKTWIGRTVYIQNGGRKTGYAVKDAVQDKGRVKIITWTEDGEGFAFTGGREWRMEAVTFYE